MNEIIPFPDGDGQTVGEVLDSMTDVQRKVMFAIVGEAWIAKPDAPMFIQHFATIGYAALNISPESFVEIQKVKSDILNDYTTGKLSDAEKRTLYNAVTIVMDYMRKELK